MKSVNYYFYKQGRCIARYEGHSMLHALTQAEADGLKAEQYESITDFYIPEPRSFGEALDDGLAVVGTAFTKARKGLGSLLERAAKAVTPKSAQ